MVFQIVFIEFLGGELVNSRVTQQCSVAVLELLRILATLRVLQDESHSLGDFVAVNT